MVDKLTVDKLHPSILLCDFILHLLLPRPKSLDDTIYGSAQHNLHQLNHATCHGIECGSILKVTISGTSPITCCHV